MDATIDKNVKMFVGALAIGSWKREQEAITETHTIHADANIFPVKLT